VKKSFFVSLKKLREKDAQIKSTEKIKVMVNPATSHDNNPNNNNWMGN